MVDKKTEIKTEFGQTVQIQIPRRDTNQSQTPQTNGESKAVLFDDEDDQTYVFSTHNIQLFDLGARLHVSEGGELEYQEVIFESQVQIPATSMLTWQNGLLTIMPPADLAAYNALWLKHLTNPEEDTFNPFGLTNVPPNNRSVSNVLQLTKPMTKYMYGLNITINDDPSTMRRLHERFDNDAYLFPDLFTVFPPDPYFVPNPAWTPTGPDADWKERTVKPVDYDENWVQQNKDDQLVLKEGTLKEKKIKGHLKVKGGGHYYNFDTKDADNYKVTKLPHYEAAAVTDFSLGNSQIKVYLVPYLRLWIFGAGWSFNFHAAYTDHELVDLTSSAQYQLGFILMRLPINPFFGPWQTWGLSSSSDYVTIDCDPRFPWSLILDHKAWKPWKLQINRMTKLHNLAVGLYFLNAVATVPDVPANWLLDHWPTEAEAQHMLQDVGYIGSGFYDHVGPRFFYPAEQTCLDILGADFSTQRYPGIAQASQPQEGLLVGIIVQKDTRYFVWRKTNDPDNLDSADWNTPEGGQVYGAAIEPAGKPSDMP
jgi:hypothetical protein